MIGLVATVFCLLQTPFFVRLPKYLGTNSSKAVTDVTAVGWGDTTSGRGHDRQPVRDEREERRDQGWMTGYAGTSGRHKVSRWQ